MPQGRQEAALVHSQAMIDSPIYILFAVKKQHSDESRSSEGLGWQQEPYPLIN